MASETKKLWGSSLGVGVVNLEVVSKRIQKNGRLLDAGCGLGFVVSAIPGEKKYGIDSNSALIEAAKSMNQGVDFSVQDAVKTSFPNGFFDTILCLDVIEHTQSQRAMLSELSRILAKGGRLLISTPLPDADFLPGAKSYTKSLHKAWGHQKLVSRDRLILMLDEAGFRIHEEVYCMYLPARLGILLYNIIYAIDVKDSMPWNSTLLRLYERLLSVVCKVDNFIRFFGPFEVLIVAVKD